MMVRSDSQLALGRGDMQRQEREKKERTVLVPTSETDTGMKKEKANVGFGF